MPKDLLSQQFKFVGRGQHEKLREFNQRINYVLRQMTREFETMPRAVVRRGESGEIISPPEATIISNNNGMIEAAIIGYYAYIPPVEEPREEKPGDTGARKVDAITHPVSNEKEPAITKSGSFEEKKLKTKLKVSDELLQPEEKKLTPDDTQIEEKKPAIKKKE